LPNNPVHARQIGSTPVNPNGFSNHQRCGNIHHLAQSFKMGSEPQKQHRQRKDIMRSNAGLLSAFLIVLLFASGCNAGTGEGTRGDADLPVNPDQRAADPSAIAERAKDLAAGGAQAERAEDLAAGDAQAEAAIVTYAREVLGIYVEPLYAGGVSREVSRALDMSPEGEAATNSIANLAIASYGAVFPDGAASLSYGDGAISGDLNVDINTASLGAYSLLAGGSMPNSEAEALNMVLGVFPGLANRTFTSTPSPDGFAWRYQGETSGFDPKTFQATLVSDVVQIGLISGRGPRGGVPIAYAVVGRGSFASDLVP
jgi:hypothetical protein